MAKQIPLVYACSGCSNVAQIANDIALRLTREERAEMSCIAGVGGGVKALVKLAQGGRPILAIDGCALHCARHCLANVGVEADLHLTLTEQSLKKRKHQVYAEGDFEEAYASVVNSMQSIN